MKAPVAAPFSWTGFYIGGHAGYGWGRKEWSDFHDPLNPTFNRAGPDAEYDVDGVLAGGQIGFNWQSGWTVFGIEADASWADIEGSGTTFYDPPLPGGSPFRGCLAMTDPCTSKIEALGTITARLGVAVDRTLFFAKGGAAWVHEKHSAGATDPDFPTNPFLQSAREQITDAMGLDRRRGK